MSEARDILESQTQKASESKGQEMSDSKTQEISKSKKQDFQNDEILWEFKHKKDFGLKLSWLFRWTFFFGGLYLIIILVQKYFSRTDNGMLIMIVLLAFFAIWFIVVPMMIYKTLNVKSMFITRTHLVIKRYIGDTIMLPLGEFYIDITRSSSSSSLGHDMEIRTFRGSEVVCSLSVFWENIENLDGLFEILKPHITEFVAALSDEQEYQRCMYLMSFSLHNIYSILHKNTKQFDIGEIETLRWEREIASRQPLARTILEQSTGEKEPEIQTHEIHKFEIQKLTIQKPENKTLENKEAQAAELSPAHTQERRDSTHARDSKDISESKGQDSQNDEIVWELCIKRDWRKFFHKFFKVWGVRLAIIGIIVGLIVLYAPYLYHTLIPAIESLNLSGKAALGKLLLFVLAALPLLFAAYIALSLIYRVFRHINVRSIHASRHHLTITRYIGGAIITPTKGLFLAKERGLFASIIISTPTNKYLYRLTRHKYIYELIDDGCAINIADFNRLNYANLKATLAYEIDIIFYRTFQKFCEGGVYDLGITINFDEIDSMRMTRYSEEKGIINA